MTWPIKKRAKSIPRIMGASKTYQPKEHEQPQVGTTGKTKAGLSEERSAKRQVSDELWEYQEPTFFPLAVSRYVRVQVLTFESLAAR